MLRPLAKALGHWAPGEGAQASTATDPLVLLGAAWSEIVGEDVARNSHPAQIVGDALMVTTRSSAWSQQLSFLAETIVAAVRARLPRAGVERLRFRVGRMREARSEQAPGRRAGVVRSRASKRPESGSVEEALARFRADVDARQRAKRAAGWKECSGCTALIAPDAGMLCVSCQIARTDERERHVARLLFEAPWLGYTGTAALVERLTPDEYDSVRRRVLARWWQILSRAAASKKLTRDGHERLVASSYVILKSGLPPERLVSATVRNVLGDDLHDLLYPTETK